MEPLIRPVSAGEVQALAPLTFPSLRAVLLRADAPYRAFGLWLGLFPAGLVILERLEDEPALGLLSISVLPGLRRRGFGSRLLGDAWRASDPARHLVTAWSDHLPGATAFEGFLAANGFGAPVGTGVRLTTTPERWRARIGRRLHLKGFDHRFWSELSAAEHEAVGLAAERLGCPPAFRPGPRQGFAPELSAVTYRQGEPVGWLFVTHYGPEAFWYEHLWTPAALERGGVLLPMLYDVTLRQGESYGWASRTVFRVGLDTPRMYQSCTKGYFADVAIKSERLFRSQSAPLSPPQ